MAGTGRGAACTGLARQRLWQQGGHGEVVVTKILLRHGLHLGGRDLSQAGDQLRPVPVSPGVLVYLDQAKRARLLRLWNSALAGE